MSASAAAGPPASGTTRPRHIALLSWRDITHPDGGGSEVYVQQVAAGLAARGHRVTLVCAAHPGAARDSIVDGYDLRRRGGRLTVYPRGLLWVARQGRRLDAVVDVINGVGFAVPLLRRRGVVGLIHHVHREQWHIIYPGPAGRLGWFVESRLIPRLYRRVPVVTVSEASRADLEGLGLPAAALRVIRNGAPDLPAPRVDRSPTPRLVVVSRLVPHKRIEQAVDVVSDLRAEVPRLVLDVVGDGWWADRLDAHIAARGAAGFVHRHGHVDARTRSDLLARAWAMLLPSVKEGWGLAVTEAASLGTPTVAYRSAGGTAESVLDGVTGLLADDYAGLVEQTRQVLRPGRAAELGAAARSHAGAFTWHETVTAFEELLLTHSP